MPLKSSANPSPPLTQNSPDFCRFIERVRDRLVWSQRLRRVERCLLAGCAAAVVGGLLMLVAGRAGMTISIACVLAGLAAGLFWCAQLRISPLAAAIIADRRFNLCDLLATAWQIQERSKGELSWRRAVLAIADARCRELDASRAVAATNRGRQWSMIGLSLALSVAIGLWPIKSGHARSAIASIPTTADGGIQNAAVSSIETPSQMRPAGGAALDEPSNRIGDADSSNTGDVEKGAAGKNGSDRAIGGQKSAAGAGMAETSAHTTPMNSLPLNTAPDQTTKSGAAAGGATGSVLNGAGDAHSAHAASASLALQAPPSQSSTWPAVQSADLQSIQSSQIEPAYQDLVRDYFLGPNTEDMNAEAQRH
ncbi:MAG: hypothetical protein ABSH22_13100 [Tepidisphaeraceae bacterium]|jgi:hypothetical protein